MLPEVKSVLDELYAAGLDAAIAVRSGILLTVNVLAINFAGLATLWSFGYGPHSWVSVLQTRRTLVKRAVVLSLAILVASAFLRNVTVEVRVSPFTSR